MANFKKDFLRFVAIGAISATATIGILKIMHRNDNVDDPTDKFAYLASRINNLDARMQLVIPATQGFDAIVMRDTIDTDGFSLKQIADARGILGAIYSPHLHCLITHYFRDTMSFLFYPNSELRNYIADANDELSHSDYHELRHAVNVSFIGRVQDQNAMLHVANEFWARVAEGIARCYDMPKISEGLMDMNVNYGPAPIKRTVFDIEYIKDGDAPRRRANYVERTNREPVLREMADTSLEYAIETFMETFEYYTNQINNKNFDTYRQSAEQNRNRALTPAQAMDSMRMFIIEGQRRDLLNMASDSVRARVARFFDEYAPQRLVQARIMAIRTAER